MLSVSKPIKDISNQAYGRLTAICCTGRDAYKRAIWLFRCACGCEIERPAYGVVNGSTSSCGCLHKEVASLVHKSHGQSGGAGKESRSYRAWRAMRDRVVNAKPGTRNYDNYAGRGITVCPQWSKFSVFLADMGNPPADRLTLERMDNDLGYTPENCRWAEPIDQVRNRRKTLFLKLGGVEKPLSVWCGIKRINYSTALWRYHRGLSPDQILFKGKLVL